MSKGAKRTTVWMDEETRALLDRLAQEDDRPLSYVIRKSLYLFAKSREPDAEPDQQAA